MKIKILKPKPQNLNSKLNELHFVKFIQNIPLVVDEKMSQRGCCSVFSLDVGTSNLKVGL
jgi:hypothetical protein